MDNKKVEVISYSDEKELKYSSLCAHKIYDEIVLIILSFIKNFNLGTFTHKCIMNCFWIIVSVLSSLYIDLEREEIIFNISTIEVIFGIVSTLMLLYGIEENNIAYIAPWMLFSAWNVFTHKFFALEFVLFYYYNSKYGLTANVFGIVTLCLKSVLWVKSVKTLIDIE